MKKFTLLICLFGSLTIISCGNDEVVSENQLVIDGNKVDFNVYHDDYGIDCLNGDRRIDGEVLCETHRAYVLAFTDGTIDAGEKNDYSYWLYLVLFSTDLENLEDGEYTIVPRDFYAVDSRDQLVARIYGGVNGYNIERFNGKLILSGEVDDVSIKIDMVVETYESTSVRMSGELLPTITIKGKYEGMPEPGMLEL